MKTTSHADRPPQPNGTSKAIPLPGSLSLQDCVGLAMAIHPDLSDAAGRIEETRGLAVQAGLYPNPRIDSGNPQQVAPTQNTLFTTGLTQEIVRAGKLKLQRAAATEVSRQAEWELVARRFEIATNVRQSFFALLAAQERQKLLGRITVIARQSERTSEALFNGGQVAKTDMLLARVERRKADAALAAGLKTLAGRRRELAAAMGQPELSISQATGKLTVSVPDFNDEAVLLQVAEANPRIQVAQLDIQRARLVLQRAEVEPIPNITVQSGAQYTPNLPHWTGLVGLYLVVPLWDRNQGNIAAAEAGIRRAAAQRDALRSELTKQLANLLARYHGTNVAVENYRGGILPDARETLELVQLAYGRGQTDVIRLLQTQRSLFEANVDYITALEDRLDAGSGIAGLLQMEEFPGPLQSEEEDDFLPPEPE